MRLFTDDILRLTFGAAEIEHENGGVTFYKCSAKQREAWRSFDEGLYRNTLPATGVRLDFHTNSKTMSFKAQSGRKFEVLLDGKLTYRLDSDCFDADGISPVLSLGNSEDVRVTLAFPSHNEKTTLEYVDLDDCSYICAHEHACKILFIGDSITQGWNSDINTLSYAWQTTLHFDADSIINGVGGGVFLESAFDIPDFDPDIVVVAYGTNDFGRYQSYEQLRGYASCFLDRVRDAYGDKKVFGISPIWRSDYNKPKNMGNFAGCCDVVKDEIKSQGFILVDGDDIVPHFECFYADAVHPNDLGFCKYADALIDSIEKAIK